MTCGATPGTAKPCGFGKWCPFVSVRPFFDSTDGGTAMMMAPYWGPI